MKNLIQKAMVLSGKSKIVLTGGVALNCKMIHSLSKQDIFEEMIAPPSREGGAIISSKISCLDRL